MAYTIEVGGSARNYTTITYERSLGSDPTECTAIIEYNATISYFDVIEVKKNGTNEWYGYLENLNPFWTKDGRYLKIKGRSRALINWKKFTERFSDSRLEGFFGNVDPAKLIHFLLRCPISDAPTASDLSKIGWGLDANDWLVSAIRTANSRHADWVKNRMIGLAWQLGPLYDELSFSVDGFTSIINDWDNNGTSGDLGDDDYATYRQAKYYSLLTLDAAAGDWNITVADGSRFPVNTYIRLSNQVASGIHGGNHEVLYIQGVAGNVITFTTQLVNAYTVANNSGALKKKGVIDEYFTLTDVSHTYGEITESHIDIFGRHVQNSWGSAPYQDAEVQIWVYDGSSWTNAGTVAWVDGEYGFGLGYPSVIKSLDVSAIIDTFEKANACRIILKQINQDADFSLPRISEINLRVTGYSYQTTNDWFKIDLGSQKNRVTGIYFESRRTANAFPVHYKIQTSPNDVDWTDKATVTSNIVQNIIESWAATDSVRYIKILITSNAPYPWEISQIYVYQADTKKYCVLNEGSGTSPQQYLGTITLGDYVSAEGVIKPINIPFGRLSEALEEIIKKSHDTNYDTWELWIDHGDGELHYAARKGSDLSGSISFVTGTHLENVSKSGNCKGCKTRIKIVGKSESKKQDEVSSDWQVNTTGETNIGSFYESILSSKKISDKDTADVKANVEARAEGDVVETFEVKVSNDTYASMAYDVGDDVTITDALTGMSGAYRLFTIKKKVTMPKGEDITFVVGSRWKDISDNWAEVKRMLREITGSGTIIEDWLAEGVDQTKLDADKISGEWEKSAQNDEQKPPANKTDDAWEITNDGVQSQDLTTNKGYFRISGSKQAGAQNTISAYVKNTESTTANIRFDKNPRFKVDFKILVEGTDPANSTSWNKDDFLDLLFGNSAFSRYFGFYVRRLGGIYELWYGKQDSGAQSWIRATETAAGTVISIQENTKYRLEAEVIWDARIIKFMFNNELLGIMPFHVSEDGSSLLFPLSMRLVTENPVGVVVYWAKAYIYKWTAEWDWVA